MVNAAENIRQNFSLILPSTSTASLSFSSYPLSVTLSASPTSDISAALASFSIFSSASAALASAELQAVGDANADAPVAANANVSGRGGNPNVVPQTSLTDTIEILIYTVCLCVGGPLNLISFRKLARAFAGSTAKAAGGGGKPCAAHVTLLKLHLNIADLLTMFVYTLSQIVWMITYQWYAGDLLCRVCKFFHTFGFYLNSFVVACFALDRAFGTCHLSTLNSSQAAQLRVRRMLTFAWIFAFALSLPQSFIFRVVEPPGMPDFKQCTPVWTIIGYEIDLEMGALLAANTLTDARKNELVARFKDVVRWERAYNIAHLLFVFWIPTLIIVASYVTILCILNSFSVPKSLKTGMSLRRPLKFSMVSEQSTRLIDERNATVGCVALGVDPQQPKIICHERVGGDGSSGVGADEMRSENSQSERHSHESTSAAANDGQRENSTVTPQNSVNSSNTTSTVMNGGGFRLMGSDATALSREKSPIAKHSSLKHSTPTTADARNQRVSASFSSPPSIKCEEDGARECARWPLSALYAEKPSLPLKLPPPTANGSGHTKSNVVGAIALRRIAKARQKTKRQAALILMAYLTFWTPYNLLAVLNAFSPNEGMLKEIASVTLPFLNSMIVMNPIVNPLIYGLYEGRRSSIS